MNDRINALRRAIGGARQAFAADAWEADIDVLEELFEQRDELLAACEAALHLCIANGYGRDSVQPQLRAALARTER